MQGYKFREIDANSAHIKVQPYGPQGALDYRDLLVELWEKRRIELLRAAYSEIWHGRQDEHVKLLHWGLSRLPQAEVVIWREDMWDAAAAGAHHFDGKVIDYLFPTMVGPQLWLPDRPTVSTPEAEEALGLDGTHIFDAIYLFQINAAKGIPKGLVMMFVCLSVEWLRAPSSKNYPALRLFTPHWENEPCTAYASAAACLEFMATPFIERQAQHLPRHVRRQAERKNRSIPDINVIYLRRPQAEADADHEPTERDWSCRWMVGFPGGFWRNQWYPSEGRHKPRLISPFLKGPADKPFRPPKPRVKLVQR